MSFTIISANWHDHRNQLSVVRQQVFIKEQQVPEELEWDEYDEVSYHVLALDEENNPIGCGRLKTDGQIGRMAVVKQWRNQGIGTAILVKILQYAKSRHMTNIFLHAQTTAIPFYQHNGFILCSAEFMDAGIAHRTMKIEWK